MSDLPPISQAEGSWLAAEYVLGLLDGSERIEVERRAAADPVFAAEVEAWTLRLAPLLADIAPVEPSVELWPRIAARLDGAPADARAPNPGPKPENVVSLAERRPAPAPAPARTSRGLQAWRVLGGLAVAASLVLVVLAGTGRLPGSPLGPGASRPSARVEPQPAPMMVASLKATQGDAYYVAAYDPVRGRMMVILPVGVAPPDRTPELWLLGADGKPVALGLARSGEVATMPVSPALARQFAAGRVLALSIEPLGGSSTGGPTGPVVASGPMRLMA